MVSLATMAGIFMLAQAAAESFCSLTIKVVDNKGRPLYAYVTVVEKSGREIEKKHEPGGVHFCDLGIRPVTIAVRPISISCHWAFSDVIDIDWAVERSATIVVPSVPCKYRPPLPISSPTSTVLFRSKDEDGNWVAESKVVFLTPVRKTIASDRHGRALIEVPIGSLVTGQVIAPNYHVREFKFICTEQVVERDIELVWIR
jgi:hypothetical protein